MATEIINGVTYEVEQEITASGELVTTKTPDTIQPIVEKVNLQDVQKQLQENVRLFTQHWLPNIQRDYDIMFEAQEISPNKEALEQMIAMFTQFKSPWDDRQKACEDLLNTLGG